LGWFGTWLRKCGSALVSAGVAERHENAGERHHTGGNLFGRPVAVAGREELGGEGKAENSIRFLLDSAQKGYRILQVQAPT
jgi:hypothetical protein